VYIHIPRCAGTFTRDVLRNTFGIKRVYRDLAYKKEAKLHKSQNKEEPFIVNRFVLCERVYPKRFHIIDEKNYDIIFGHFTIRKYGMMGWPFITFLRDPVERVISEYNALKRENEKYFNLSVVEYASLNRNLLTWMLNGSIDDLSFIGFVEKYEESLERLESFLGKKVIRIGRARKNHSNYKNRKYKKYMPTDEERKIIESFNKLDMELYREAYETIS